MGRLLLVEDIEVNQVLARTLLEADGHTVDVVSSGEEAIEAIKGKTYDVVLMDVQMPGMGGVEATRAIRKLAGAASLPIIAMTANVLAEQIRDFRESGMDDHVGKPINRTELRATLARWIDPDRPTEKPPETALFDPAIYDAIAALLGPAKTVATLRKFEDELGNRLKPDDLSRQDMTAFRRDAHVVTSVAGMMGFTDLAEHCGALLTLPKDTDFATFERQARDLLRAKTRVVETLPSLKATVEREAQAA